MLPTVVNIIALPSRHNRQNVDNLMKELYVNFHFKITDLPEGVDFSVVDGRVVGSVTMG